MHDLIQALTGALLAALLNMACAGGDASTIDAPGEDATETNVTRPTLLPDEPPSLDEPPTPDEPELTSSGDEPMADEPTADEPTADEPSAAAADGGTPAPPQTE